MSAALHTLTVVRYLIPGGHAVAEVRFNDPLLVILRDDWPAVVDHVVSRTQSRGERADDQLSCLSHVSRVQKKVFEDMSTLALTWRNDHLDVVTCHALHRM